MISNAVLFKSYKNWILNATVVESSRACRHKLHTWYFPDKQITRFFPNYFLQLKRMEKAISTENTLFVNQAVFFKLLKLGKVPMPNEHSVFFTHLNESLYSKERQAEMLDLCKRVFVYNESSKQELVAIGLNSKKVETVYGGVDRKIFFPSVSIPREEEEFVLVVGDCKPRKNPELIRKVISHLPEVKFIIHGNNWAHIFEGSSLPKNLEIRDFSFANQPTLMRSASTFLTLSRLEGGPYPTIEALASGTPVVASDTGWNRDVIPPGGGFIIENLDSLSEICHKLMSAINLKSRVYATDLLHGALSWSELGKKIFELKF